MQALEQANAELQSTNARLTASLKNEAEEHAMALVRCWLLLGCPIAACWPAMATMVWRWWAAETGQEALV